jgi:hypothetical protein
MAVAMKSTIYWDMFPCSLEVHRRFEGTSYVRPWGSRINQARYTLFVCFGLLFDPEDGGCTFLRNVG